MRLSRQKLNGAKGHQQDVHTNVMPGAWTVGKNVFGYVRNIWKHYTLKPETQEEAVALVGHSYSDFSWGE